MIDAVRRAAKEHGNSMKVHGLAWKDSGGHEAPSVDIKDTDYLGRFMKESMGIDFKLWNRRMIHASLASDNSVRDCDVLLVQMLSIIRYGGRVSKWDADVCDLVNHFDGPVVIFINDQSCYKFLNTIANPKWGDMTITRPLYLADDRPIVYRTAAQSRANIIGHLNLNQTWAYAWLWKRNPEHMRQLLDEPVKPEHEFIYGGLTRGRNFNRRLDSIFSVFGVDNCISYGKVSERFGMEDLSKNWGLNFALPDQLMELNSSCRYSALPYDKDKNYITTRCFEQGFADCLVLCDKGYNQEDCGFPVVDYMDKDAIASYRDMPEAERIRAVKNQHDRLASIDYGSRCAKMMDRFFKDIGF